MVKKKEHKKLEAEYPVLRELESKIKDSYKSMLIAMSKSVGLQYWNGLIKEDKNVEQS
jgi:hypothetical protein